MENCYQCGKSFCEKHLWGDFDSFFSGNPVVYKCEECIGGFESIVDEFIEEHSELMDRLAKKPLDKFH